MLRSHTAPYLIAKASWEAADACLKTHGGFACEYDVMRKFRASSGAHLHEFSSMAEHPLALPRSC